MKWGAAIALAGSLSGCGSDTCEPASTPVFPPPHERGVCTGSDGGYKVCFPAGAGTGSILKDPSWDYYTCPGIEPTCDPVANSSYSTHVCKDNFVGARCQTEVAISASIFSESMLRMKPAIGDVDDDGRLDLVFLTEGDPGDKATDAIAWLLLQTPQGRFESAEELGTVGGLSIGVHVGDLDSDGRLDIVVANGDPRDDAGLPLVLLGGEGGLQPVERPLPVGEAISLVDDLDGDGDVEVVTVSEVGISIHTNFLDSEPPTQSLNLRETHTIRMTVHGVTLNDDGALDLVVKHRAGHWPWTVLMSAPSGYAVASREYRFDGGFFGDFTGSGSDDVVFQDRSLVGNSLGSFATGAPPPTSPYPAPVLGADIDGDGLLDMLNLCLRGPYETEQHPDDDPDGPPSFISLCTDGGRLTGFRGRGDGSFRTPVVFDATPANFEGGWSADLDGDRQDELYGYADNGDLIRVDCRFDE